MSVIPLRNVSVSAKCVHRGESTAMWKCTLHHCFPLFRSRLCPRLCPEIFVVIVFCFFNVTSLLPPPHVCECTCLLWRVASSQLVLVQDFIFMSATCHRNVWRSTALFFSSRFWSRRTQVLLSSAFPICLQLTDQGPTEAHQTSGSFFFLPLFVICLPKLTATVFSGSYELVLQV